jgi:small subunit ribosomal protein S4
VARYTGPKCRLCRREGTKLFLKGARCATARCAVTRRSYPPGMRAWQRTRHSDYAIQLREKQKLKRSYGLLEKQFRNYFRKAEQMSGNTGENLLSTLERRLDNVVYLLGLATSRAQARQNVGHGHIMVNRRRVSLPGYLVKVQDVIKPDSKEASQNLARQARQANKGRDVPSWLELDEEQLEGRVLNLPTREDVTVDVQEQLVIELCSK